MRYYFTRENLQRFLGRRVRVRLVAPNGELKSIVGTVARLEEHAATLRDVSLEDPARHSTRDGELKLAFESFWKVDLIGAPES